MSNTITATGPRGFLLWLKEQQPGIYQMLAPELPSLVPEIFTQVEAKLGRIRGLRGLYKAKSFYQRGKQQKFGALGQYFCDVDLCAISISPTDTYLPEIDTSAITTDFGASLSDPGNLDIDSGSPVINYQSQISYTNPVAGVDPGPTPTLASEGDTVTGAGGGSSGSGGSGGSGASGASGQDIANAANSGVMSAGTAAQIAAAIGAVANTVLTAGEVGLLGKAIQAQLTNAQSGLAPKTISTASLGIPTVAAKGMNFTDLLLIGAAAIAAYYVMQS